MYLVCVISYDFFLTDEIVSCCLSARDNGFEKDFLGVFNKRNKVDVISDIDDENPLIGVLFSLWMVHGSEKFSFNDGGGNILKPYFSSLFQPRIFLFIPLNFLHTLLY